MDDRRPRSLRFRAFLEGRGAHEHVLGSDSVGRAIFGGSRPDWKRESVAGQYEVRVGEPIGGDERRRGNTEAVGDAQDRVTLLDGIHGRVGGCRPRGPSAPGRCQLPAQLAHGPREHCHRARNGLVEGIDAAPVVRGHHLWRCVEIRCNVAERLHRVDLAEDAEGGRDDQDLADAERVSARLE